MLWNPFPTRKMPLPGCLKLWVDHLMDPRIRYQPGGNDWIQVVFHCSCSVVHCDLLNLRRAQGFLWKKYQPNIYRKDLLPPHLSLPTNNYYKNRKFDKVYNIRNPWPFLTLGAIILHPTCLPQTHLSYEKNPLTFHYTGCLIGILIMVYYSPHMIR